MHVHVYYLSCMLRLFNSLITLKINAYTTFPRYRAAMSGIKNNNSEQIFF